MCKYVGEYSEENLELIQKMNKKTLKDINFVQPGDVLKIPDNRKPVGQKKRNRASSLAQATIPTLPLGSNLLSFLGSVPFLLRLKYFTSETPLLPRLVPDSNWQPRRPSGGTSTAGAHRQEMVGLLVLRHRMWTRQMCSPGVRWTPSLPRVVAPRKSLLTRSRGSRCATPSANSQVLLFYDKKDT